MLLKGRGRPWETLPLNNPPFLPALENAILQNCRFTTRLDRFFSETTVLPGPHTSGHSAADPRFQDPVF